MEEEEAVNRLLIYLIDEVMPLIVFLIVTIL